jgi:4,5-dihydroxyphthalate decarboxylase
MSKLPLTIACWDYDRTRAIMDGRVGVEGCDVNYLPLAVEETFFRAFKNAEFDACELSFSTYLLSLSRERDLGIALPYRAVPAFVSRVFRHSGIYIRTDRGIRSPADLKGKVVGVPEYQMTAAVWIRGILEHEYGVPTASMSWRNGGIEEPGRTEKVPFTLPPSIHLESIDPGKTLNAMLEAGEIDAIVSARAPSCLGRSPNVARLFPDFRTEEKAYFKRTGVFPMMHVVGIRKSLVDAHPWLATSVYKAFLQAKDLAYPELTQMAALKIALPWLGQEVQDTIALMGKDFWAYGTKENKAALDAFLQYHFEQGLSGKKKFAIEDIFFPSTLEISRL